MPSPSHPKPHGFAPTGLTSAECSITSSAPHCLLVEIGFMTASIVVRGLDQLGALLAVVTPEDVGRPTPCSGWTVADLSDHLVNSVAGMAAMAKGW